MRETPLSNCERQLILQAIADRQRLDGRQTYDYRNIKITFGTEYGCCIVELGKTRVLAQVSCELATPKPSRPTEGTIFFNLELSPMASPAFEPGRQSELLVKLNRLLERCLRNSKCIDTESLCVVAGAKVWQIRVDLHLLNHDGNIIDAASIAAIVALSHFKRPDVSIQGEVVTVYTAEERDLIPLSIHHMPIAVSFAFFQQGTYLLVDPIEHEERVMDGLLVIAMNKHRELCTIQSSGGIMLLKEQILRCTKIAGVKVAEITELMQKALENDKNVRKEGGKFGFAESIPNKRITSFKLDEVAVPTEGIEEQAEEIVSKAETSPAVIPKPIVRAPGTGQIGEGIQNEWMINDLEDDEDEDEEDIVPELGAQSLGNEAEIIHLSESEEEEMVILEPEGCQKKEKKTSKGTQQKTSKIISQNKNKKTQRKKRSQL
ncbi:exosome complex component RRP45 isoform X1 [Amblyraja radiata]|uniref:exosome complex component RRP45 isoform X1 n=2 Tax=Amblyraja radiata TaxID=386614 RepID=UPI001403A5A2|nr:exosome complex component RRP45 isoform X1 [Amblyraja radiata]